MAALILAAIFILNTQVDRLTKLPTTNF